MSTTKTKEPNKQKKGENVEVKVVPEGTFGGTREKPVLVEENEPQPEDTGDQGRGQN